MPFIDVIKKIRAFNDSDQAFDRQMMDLLLERFLTALADLGAAEPAAAVALNSGIHNELMKS